MNNIKKITQKDRYGAMISYEFDIPPMNEIPKPEGDHPGGPKGTDTVPAWLTPGENVVNAEASRLYQPILDKMNDHGRAIQKQQGGPIPSYNANGGQIDYYGNNYNQSTINSEISTLKGMGLSDVQIIQALMNNLNMSQGEAQAALMPAYEADGGAIGMNNEKIDNSQINYGGKNTYTDYLGKPYQVSKLYQPVNDSLISNEVTKMKEMGLPSNQMMTALEDNLNLSSEQAIGAMQPKLGSNNASQIPPLYNAAGTPSSTDLVQKFMDQASYNHDSVYRARPPKYFNEGGVTITDDIINAMMQVESGGDVNAESEAGAIGPMQIRPSTAQNPGYGVKPLALEDLKNPVLAKDFAKRYMQKLADRNPTLSLDEIKTAYHSGLGNVLKDKSGEEALGPRGKAYAGKVNAEMGNVPVQTAMYDGSELSYPNAQNYSTNATSEFIVDNNRDPYSYSAEEFSPEIKNKIEENKKKYGEEVKLDAAGNVIDPNIPNPYSEFGVDEIPSETLAEGYANDAISKEEYEFGVAKNKQKDVQEKAYQKQIVEEEREKGLKINSDIKDQINIIDEQIAEAKKNKDNLLVKALIKKKQDISKGIVKVNPSEEEKEAKADEKKKAAQAISDQLNNEEDIDQTVMNNEEVNQWMKDNPGKSATDKFIDKAKEVGGIVLDKSMEYFKNAFSSMFDGEELARMAMIYAGSRALGYNHGGSLNYSMKNYMKRVDANLSAAKKFSLTDKAREDYTEASLKQYAKTGDRDTLIPKGKTIGLQSVSGNIYVPGYGKMTTYKTKGGAEYVQVEGKPIAVTTIKGAEKWDDKVHGDATVAKRYDTFGKQTVDAINAQNNVEKGDDGYIAYKPLGSQANSIYRKILRQNSTNINDAPQMQMAVERAMDKFLQAKADYNAKKTTIKPNDLESYVNLEVFTSLTGISQSFISGTSASNLAKINKDIKRDMTNKNPRSQAYKEEYINDWQGTLDAYKKIPNDERTQLIKEAAEKSKDKNKWSAFTLWVSRTSPEEIEKLIKS